MSSKAPFSKCGRSEQRLPGIDENRILHFARLVRKESTPYSDSHPFYHPGLTGGRCELDGRKKFLFVMDIQQRSLCRKDW